MMTPGRLTSTAYSRAAIATRDDPYAALNEVLDAVRDVQPADLVLLFVSTRFARFLPALVARVREQLRPGALAGCTTSGVIGDGEEQEQSPSISLVAMRLPGAKITTVRLGEWLHDAGDDPDLWRSALDLPASAVNGILLIADPFRTDTQSFTMGLHRAYPDAVIAGGVTSGSLHQRQSWIVCDGDVHTDGGVAVAIGGGYTIEPVVSQGCEPIGQTWTITGVNKQWIESISNRPAMDVLRETLRELPADERERASRNLLAGLAANEYQDDFQRGDFLVRSITGIEQEGGAIALGALPRIGQTIQFQVRDVATAADDLRAMLELARHRLGEREPVAALLCSCTGRGAEFFGQSHHDAGAVRELFPNLPTAGFFATSEIGPIGRRPFLHGFSTVAGLVVSRE